VYILRLSVEWGGAGVWSPGFGVESCCCHGQLTSFPLVTISTAVGRLSRRLQFRAPCCQLTSKADKLPMDTEPVARDNSTIFALKLGD